MANNNFNQLLQQAQRMKDQLQKAQEKMQSVEFVGTSGGGMVSVTINGKGEMLRVHIDPKLMSQENVEIVSDLVVAAYNDARSKLETAMNEQMGSLFGGMGMQSPFGSLF